MEKNTKEVWDSVYDEGFSYEKHMYLIKVKQKSVVWRRIRKKIIDKFGSFKGLKTIEIGSGEGFVSLLFAMEGADVTLLDYSENSLKASKILFDRTGMEAKRIQMDALNIDETLHSKFDISHSHGTAEHFIGDNRIKFIKSHMDVLNEGGITFIAVPNKFCIQYRVWKFLSELFGRWKFGEEYPFSGKELKSIGKQIGTEFDVIGGGLFHSPLHIIRRIKQKLNMKIEDISKVRNKIATPLDSLFGYTLVAIGNKSTTSE